MTERAALWCAIGLTAAISAFSITAILHVQQHQNDALHSIICQAEHAIRVRPWIPHKQRVQALNFYRHASTRAHLAPCPSPTQALP